MPAPAVEQEDASSDRSLDRSWDRPSDRSGDFSSNRSMLDGRFLVERLLPLLLFLLLSLDLERRGVVVVLVSVGGALVLDGFTASINGRELRRLP